VNKRFLNYSFSKYLRKLNKSSDEFEFMLNQLTLEELIALKLEISSRSVNGKLYGFNLWYNIPRIAREALLLFAVSATTNIIEAQTLLGIKDVVMFRKILYKYKTSLKHYNVMDIPNRKYVKKVLGGRKGFDRVKEDDSAGSQ